MTQVLVAGILELPVQERIQLVEDIWDTIASEPEPIVLTPGQREELDRRLEDYRQNQTAGSPWDDVRERILKSGR